jgi:hypothetical protein
MVKAKYNNVQLCGHAMQIGHLEVEALRLLAELHLQCYTANGNKMDATAALSLFTEAYPRLCDLQSCDINQGVPDEVLHVIEQVCSCSSHDVRNGLASKSDGAAPCSMLVISVDLCHCMTLAARMCPYSTPFQAYV